MKLLKCNNGHFYDGDKFSSCPHCQNQVGVPGEPSFGGGEDVTVPVNVGAMGGGVGAAHMGGFVDEGVTVPAGGWGAPSSPAASWQGGSDVTVPAGAWDNPAAGVTVPVTPMIDDEKTQGMFVIPEVEAAPGKSAPAPVTAQDLAAGWLVCIKGVNRGKDFKLRVGHNSIGRSESNDVALLGDTSVSREGQAQIVYEPQGNKFYVLPGSSRSLAYMNGQVLLSKIEMHKNDVLELGKAHLMLIPCCDDKFNWKDVFAK